MVNWVLISYLLSTGVLVSPACQTRKDLNVRHIDQAATDANKRLAIVQHRQKGKITTRAVTKVGRDQLGLLIWIRIATTRRASKVLMERSYRFDFCWEHSDFLFSEYASITDWKHHLSKRALLCISSFFNSNCSYSNQRSELIRSDLVHAHVNHLPSEIWNK